jgi:hypothetical protein
LLVSLAFAAAFVVAGPADARTSDVPDCTPTMRATVNPQQTPTGVDLNAHQSVGLDYVVTGCNLTSQDTSVRIEGLGDPAAVAGTFEADGDGIGYLHLDFKRSAIPPGSNDVRIVISGPLVRTSVLTFILDKRSPIWIAWLIALIGFVGGLLLFGLRTLDSNVGWWKVWRWKAFQPVSGILVLVAAGGASLGVLFASLPIDWNARTDWWPFFLKVGTAAIGAATAIAAGQAVTGGK